MNFYFPESTKRGSYCIFRELDILKTIKKHIYIYIYIYRERERERESGGDIESNPGERAKAKEIE